MKDFLQYGDLVLIQQNIHSGSSFRPGYLSTTVYADKNVYLQRLVGNQENRSGKNELPINTRDLIFEITPKLKSDAHHEFRQAKKLSQDNQELGNISSGTSPKLKKLEAKVAEEKETNRRLIDYFQSHYVTYGSEIQLMHYDTESFLSAKNRLERGDVFGYSARMGDWQSQSMIFKLLPKYSSEPTGERVRFTDLIVLLNTKFNAYLSVREQPEESEFFFQPLESDVVHLNFCDEGFLKHLVYLSTSPIYNFTFKLFRKFSSKTSNNIFSFDVVTLTHTELRAKLCADTNYTYERMTKEFVHFKLDSEDPIDYTLNSFWIIEEIEHDIGALSKMVVSDAPDKMSLPPAVRVTQTLSSKVLAIDHHNSAVVENKPSNLLFNINPLMIVMPMPFDEKEGNYVSPQIKNVFLRHLATGKLLTHDQQGNLYLGTTGTQLWFDIVDGSAYLLNNSVFFIRSNAGQITSGYGNLNSSPQSSLSKHKKLINFSPSESSCKKVPTKFSMHLTPQDVFEIQRLPSTILQLIACSRTAVTKLRIFLEKFKLSSTIKEKDLIYAKETLIFLNQSLGPLSENRVFKNSILLRKNKQILRESLLIDILMEITYVSFETYKVQKILEEMSTLEQTEAQKHLFQLIRLVVSTLRNLISDCLGNVLYASQWLNFLLDKATGNIGKIDTDIGLMLTELIDNNDRILYSRITENIISRVIRDARNGSTDLYFLNLLRAFFVSNNRILIQNQLVVTKFLLEQETFSEMAVLIENSADRATLLSNKMLNFRTDLFNLSDKVSRYLVFYFSLMKDLCRKQNNLAILFLKGVYSSQTILQIISNDYYDTQTRKVFFEFFCYLYVKSLIKICDSFKRVIAFENNHQDVEFEQDGSIDLVCFFNLCLSMFENQVRQFEPNNPHSSNMLRILSNCFLGFLKREVRIQTESLRLLDSLLLNAMSILENLIPPDNLVVELKKFLEQFSMLLITFHDRILCLSLKSKVSGFFSSQHLNIIVNFQEEERREILQEKHKEFLATQKVFKFKLQNPKNYQNITNFLRKAYFNRQDFQLVKAGLRVFFKLFDSYNAENRFLDSISLVLIDDDLSIYRSLKKISIELVMFLRPEITNDSNKLAKLHELLERLETFICSKKNLEFRCQLRPQIETYINFLIMRDFNQVVPRRLQLLVANLNILNILFSFLKIHTSLSLSEETKELLNRIYMLLIYIQRSNPTLAVHIAEQHFEIIECHIKQRLFFALGLIQEILESEEKLILNKEIYEKFQRILTTVLCNSENDAPVDALALNITRVCSSYHGLVMQQNQNSILFRINQANVLARFKRNASTLMKSVTENSILLLVDEFSSKIIVGAKNISKDEELISNADTIKDEHGNRSQLNGSSEFFSRSNAVRSMVLRVSEDPNNQDISASDDSIIDSSFRVSRSPKRFGATTPSQKVFFNDKLNYAIVTALVLQSISVNNPFCQSVCKEVLSLSQIGQLLKQSDALIFQPAKLMLLLLINIAWIDDSDDQENSKELGSVLEILKSEYLSTTKLLQKVSENQLDTFLVFNQEMMMFRELLQNYITRLLEMIHQILKSYGNSKRLMILPDIEELKLFFDQHYSKLTELMKKHQIATVRNDSLIEKINNLTLLKKSLPQIDTIRFAPQKRSRIDKLSFLINFGYSSDSITRNDFGTSIESVFELYKDSEQIRLKELSKQTKKNYGFLLFTDSLTNQNLFMLLYQTKDIEIIKEYVNFLSNAIKYERLNYDKENEKIFDFVYQLLHLALPPKTTYKLIRIMKNCIINSATSQKQLYKFQLGTDLKSPLNSIRHFMITSLELLIDRMKEVNRQFLQELYRFQRNRRKKILTISMKPRGEDVGDQEKILNFSFELLTILASVGKSNQSFLCGHYQGQTINFVALAANFYSQLVKVINVKCMRFAIPLLNFFLELIRGPSSEAHKELIDLKLMESSIELFKDFSDKHHMKIRGFTEPSFKKSLQEVFLLNCILMISLLQLTPEAITPVLASKIPPRFLFDQLEFFYDIFIDKYNHSKSIKAELQDEEISPSVYYACLFFMIDEKTNCYSNFISNLSPKDIELYQFFRKRISKIEVLYDQQLYHVYFPIFPACYNIKYMKEQFLSRLDRENAIKKISSFIKNSPDIFAQLDHLNAIQFRIPFLNPLLYQILYSISLICIVIINVNLILFLERKVQHNKSELYFSNSWSEQIVFFSQICFLGFKTLQMIVWIMLNMKPQIIRKWRARLEILKRKLLSTQQKSDDIKKACDLLQKNGCDYSFKDFVVMLRVSHSLEQHDGLPYLEVISLYINYSINKEFFFDAIILSLVILTMTKNGFYALMGIPLFSITVS